MTKEYTKLRLEEELRFYLREEDFEIATEAIAFWFDDEYYVIPLKRMTDKVSYDNLAVIQLLNGLNIKYTVIVNAGEVVGYLPVSLETLEQYFSLNEEQYKAFTFIFNEYRSDLFYIAVEDAYHGNYTYWPTREDMLRDHWVSAGYPEEAFKYVDKDNYEYAIKGDFIEINGEYWQYDRYDI